MRSLGRKLALSVSIAALALVVCSCSAPASSVKHVNSVAATSGVLPQFGSVATSTETTAPAASDLAVPIPPSVVLAPPSSLSAPRVIDGFVRVSEIDDSIVIDLKYATADNFTGQKVYPTNVCVLRLGTAKKLANANAELGEMGYHLKIWDAYRPVSVQKIFWSIMPDSRYVANPAKGGSIHNRGCAVDVTLVDQNGNDVEMPTGFDDFTAKASPSSSDMSPEARANLDALRKAMIGSGFKAITTEWWHFTDGSSAEYKIADVDLSRF